MSAGEGIKNSVCLMTELAGPFPHCWVLSCSGIKWQALLDTGGALFITD